MVDQNTPLSITAEHLGISLEHVRNAVHTMLHRPLRKWGPNSAPRAFATQQRARTLLTPEFFQREYVTGGKRLRQLHVEPGFHRKTLADYAKHAGVTIAAAREPHPIHEAWLRTQYLRRRRSFPLAPRYRICLSGCVVGPTILAS